MITTILQIIGSILGIAATWYIGKQGLKWWQAYQTRKQEGELTDERSKAQNDNQKANSESEKLKKIDGR